MTEKFIVCSSSGWKCLDPDTGKIILFQYFTEFEALRHDTDHIIFYNKILPVRSMDESVIAVIEKKCLEDMSWKIINSNETIDFYSDKELLTYTHSCFPNTEIAISSSFINFFDRIFKTRDGDFYFQGDYDTKIVPMTSLVVVKIINTDGVLVRSSKEIYSSIQGIIPFGSKIVIQDKDFTSIPSNSHIQRYQLFKNKGWFNASSFSGTPNIEILAKTINPFQYELVLLDMNSNNPFITQEDNVNPHCIICLTRNREIAVSHDTYAHLLYCSICAKIMEDRGEKCPLCRTPVVRYLRMYQ